MSSSSSSSSSSSCCGGQRSLVMPGKRKAACSAHKNEASKKKVLLGSEIKSRVIYASVRWRKSFPSLTYSFHRCLLHALGPLLTFFPAALDYSIMLKVGRSCLFSLLYLCTCRYHAVTKYMAASHRSLCNTFTHGLERGGLMDA